MKFIVSRLRKDNISGIKLVNTTINISPPDDSKRIRVFNNKNEWIDTKPITYIHPDLVNLSSEQLKSCRKIIEIDKKFNGQASPVG